MARVALALACTLSFCCSAALAAEPTTGSIVGSVSTQTGAPIAGAKITADSSGAHLSARTDATGTFTIFGAPPDTFVVSASAAGYADVSEQMLVNPGTSVRVQFVLASLVTIGSVHSIERAFTVGSTSDQFTVLKAQAHQPSASASGLGSYTAGTVQGALNGVPGVEEDQFANAILRGGKIDDAAFDYDSVPFAQGLIAEPGGNVIGAQLPTTGVAATTVTLAGIRNESENALGGVIDEIPEAGMYPGRTLVSATSGVGALTSDFAFDSRWATPDLRWRYMVAMNAGNDYFKYGDGHTFYPAEAATYGLSLQNRGAFSLASTVHDRMSSSDDLSATLLFGSASYRQYDSPFPGETVGEFDGDNTVFPGETDPNAPVHYASALRGSYDVIDARWQHIRPHSLERIALYQSQFGSIAGGPFWDDDSFPDGQISLSEHQGGRLSGLTFDVDDVASARHHITYGLNYRIDNSFLHQVVPTADEFIDSQPTLTSQLVYLNDTWSPTSRTDVSGTARFVHTHVAPSDGAAYDVSALDPHLAVAQRLSEHLSLRATFDHTTVAPKPLEADRTDSTNVDGSGDPAPFVPLAPETGNIWSYSLDGSHGGTQFRASYYALHDRNRIDVLPFNFRSAVNAGENPEGLGVPTNAGELVAHGVELWAKNGALTFDLNAVRGYSSSASQFAYNELNAVAVAAGHLFPIGYVPDVTALLSYDVHIGKRLRVTPQLSWESGYPYGNGTAVWTIGPDGKPVTVPNDNYINPGYNYYFLRDPSQPFNAVTNPYVATMGTPEGPDPNSLRTTPQLLASLHIEADLSSRLTLVADVANLFNEISPTQLQSNPYLIGPPGYAGGNAAYAAWYQNAAGFAAPYTLGNGIPTIDGVTQALPWNYGTGGYVPSSFPLGRTMNLTLRWSL